MCHKVKRFQIFDISYLFQNLPSRFTIYNTYNKDFPIEKWVSVDRASVPVAGSQMVAVNGGDAAGK